MLIFHYCYASILAFVVAAFALLVINYIGSSKIGAVALVTVSVAFSGLIQAGPSINQLDIAPQFAGVLMGISNMAGTIPGIVAPFVAKIIAHTVSLYLQYAVIINFILNMLENFHSMYVSSAWLIVITVES